jgi:hypothetical protein
VVLLCPPPFVICKSEWAAMFGKWISLPVVGMEGTAPRV